ncbi:hypothetical protein SAMN02745134_00278 [Clostridium acidisoli DSM 12555]|uniref:Short NACHT-associated C-terminal domain-containing protein n=1 Tax=Clostridium acidisoli DSM 12555 TaxID=1121291 RepID=A0A1W1WZW7_9CLOT|nr:hypothetical protein [Clostridium acidisoli]SMC17276.1 hypothetical protein SAMN02745134_00278 [Clostridium acidisoli DSM 12555]
MLNGIDTNKIKADVITDLAKSVANLVLKKMKDYFIDVQNREEIDLGHAFEEYLNYSKEIQCKIKTLLYRHTPKKIYSFYECIGLKCDGKIIDTCDVNNILNVGHKIIVTGTGGIGKSVMMKHLFLNCMEKVKLIPILIELRGLNDINEKDIDLVEYMYQVMNRYKFKLDKKYFEYSLETGCYLILLDGFDEVKNGLSEKVTKCILDLCDKYPDNYYVTTSRPLDEFVGWNGFTELQSMTLSKKQALSLIKKLEYDENIKNKFYIELDKKLYKKYQTFVSNPLLLTIMLLTFENRISVPDKLNDFYEQAFTTLFHTHDASKGGYKRDISCRLGYEDFKAVFSYFCFKSFFNSEYEFSEDKIIYYISTAKSKKIITANFDSSSYLKDLTNSVCMLIHEGLDYRFSHRSFQEYFAALYTVQLDDDQQKRFLSAWLKENTFRITTNYLDMLYELQQSRFIKNVLYPGLIELRNFYEENDKSNEIVIPMIYSSIGVGNEGRKLIGCAAIKNSYYAEIINRTCKIAQSDKCSRNEEDFIVKLLQDKYRNTNTDISFEKLINDGLFSELEKNSCWIIERFKTAMEFVSNYDTLSIGRKKKFSSMLDEL